MNPVHAAMIATGATCSVWARALGSQVRRQNVEYWVSTGKVPVEHCAALEVITNGRLRRWDLRPNDWHAIWPELINARGAPPVPEGDARATTPQEA